MHIKKSVLRKYVFPVHKCITYSYMDEEKNLISLFNIYMYPLHINIFVVVVVARVQRYDDRFSIETCAARKCTVYARWENINFFFAIYFYPVFFF